MIFRSFFFHSFYYALGVHCTVVPVILFAVYKVDHVQEKGENGRQIERKKGSSLFLLLLKYTITRQGQIEKQEKEESTQTRTEKLTL